MLDALVPDRPAYLTSYDGHTGWANSAALKLAGITRRTRNPVERRHRQGSAHGRADRRAEGSGDGSGDAAAAASRRATSSWPRCAPRSPRRIAAASPACRTPAATPTSSISTTSCGATAISTVRVYAALSAGRDLTADAARRVRPAAREVLRRSAVQDRRDQDRRRRRRSSRTRRRCSSRTPTSRRARRAAHDGRALNRLVAELDKRGWQIMIHAIGDRAIRMALDAFEHAAADAIPRRRADAGIASSTSRPSIRPTSPASARSA